MLELVIGSITLKNVSVWVLNMVEDSLDLCSASFITLVGIEFNAYLFVELVKFVLLLCRLVKHCQLDDITKSSVYTISHAWTIKVLCL
jgi:hypothetical protein